MEKNPFPYSSDNKRYHTYHWELLRRFGCKVSRLSLSGGFTCPNLDGTRGRGGCAFCAAGSGQFAGNPGEPVALQYRKAAEAMGAKWATEKHIAYFQPNSNTYGPIDKLRRLYSEALACPGVVGLAVATRPDCLPEEVCDLLAEFREKTYLVVELGLQTIHDRTGEALGRGHSWADFLEGYEKLSSRGILTGVHLINGLPGETPDQMLQSAKTLGKLRLHLLKLHMLYLTRGTRLAKAYQEGEFSLLSREEYVKIVCDQLEWLPASFVIGRLTGDGEPDILIGPDWSRKKLCVLNEIDKELLRRGSWQGKALEAAPCC